MNYHSCPQLMVPPVILLFSSFLPQGQQRLAIALLLAGGLDRTARAPSTRCATGAAAERLWTGVGRC